MFRKSKTQLIQASLQASSKTFWHYVDTVREYCDIEPLLLQVAVGFFAYHTMVEEHIGGCRYNMQRNINTRDIACMRYHG